jgi:hypothetical protein
MSRNEHRIIWAVVIFICADFPQWLSAVWALFSSIPLYQWIQEKGIVIPHFSLLWITWPIGLILIGVLVLNSFKENKKSYRPDSHLEIETVQSKSKLPEKHRFTDLNHKQISAAISAAPPLQRESICASFIGLHVSWRGKLSAARLEQDKMRVSISMVGGGFIHCTAAPRDCDALLLAPQDTEIVVRGKIKNVSIGDGVLEDCKFEIPKTPPIENHESIKAEKPKDTNRQSNDGRIIR